MILVVFSLVGFLFFDMVYVATAMNYAVQSELLVWLVSSITSLLRNHQYHNVDAAIKVTYWPLLEMISSTTYSGTSL